MGSPVKAEDKIECLSIQEQLKHLLEEARVILPGMQALFGFQLIAIFNEPFSKRFNDDQQAAHIAATFLLAVAIILAMAPAAFHRQAEPDRVSESLVRISTGLLSAALIPMMLGLTIDIYLLCVFVTGRIALGYALSALALLLCIGLWYVLPGVHRANRSENTSPAPKSA